MSRLQAQIDEDGTVTGYINPSKPKEKYNVGDYDYCNYNYVATAKLNNKPIIEAMTETIEDGYSYIQLCPWYIQEVCCLTRFTK